MAQNDAKDAPKRFQEAPKRRTKAIPNGKTKKGPNQDDPKTVLDRPVCPLSMRSREAIWDPKTIPKRTPKR